MYEQSKEGKLKYKCRSASNPGSHDTFLSVSQQEAVISLAPDCMCSLAADIFDEKQYAVGCVCRVCKSGGQLCFLAITRSHWGVESISFSLLPARYSHTHTPATPKSELPEMSVRCEM